MTTALIAEENVLTERQLEVLEFIIAYVTDHGMPPTVKELGRHFGMMSNNGVVCHLKPLEAKGYITRDKLLARAIRLTPKATAGRATAHAHGALVRVSLPPGPAVDMTAEEAQAFAERVMAAAKGVGG